MASLNGKIAIVAGVSNGIGQAIAERRVTIRGALEALPDCCGVVSLASS